MRMGFGSKHIECQVGDAHATEEDDHREDLDQTSISRQLLLGRGGKEGNVVY